MESKNLLQRGKVRVGKCTWKNGQRQDPSYPGFTSIVSLTKSTPYGDIGPYCLKDEKGRIMENLWQGSKVYAEVPFSKQFYSRYDRRVIWKWSAERHCVENPDGSYKILPTWSKWSEALKAAKDPVRYPVGFKHRHKCLFAIDDSDGTPRALSYIPARKQIYVKTYTRLVKRHSTFKRLKQRLDEGENLLINEVDGVHQVFLHYYERTYGVSEDWIVGNTIEINEENLIILLNDEQKPFGHGFCLAAALLDIDLLAC